MLTKKLRELKQQLSKIESLNRDQKELLYELNFFDTNDGIKKIVNQEYSIRKVVMESFAAAPSICQLCGKKL
ncbi:hypothetical protein [Chryseobacterium sp. FH1]|uniref:hypothetical protein n=1 Tax=Chryseobacterium sp. FH1 TaxID=1233951 RepID=UPI0004E414A1|nr:hypothetical protein [Chryseobacterium sp. FH1]KFC20425.1 hypothetical protein IO90_14810 [Chryseobacterium sp. FH1]